VSIKEEDAPSSPSVYDGDQGKRILILFAFFVLRLLGRGNQERRTLLILGYSNRGSSFPYFLSASLVTALVTG
jgi:hypothetical protein